MCTGLLGTVSEDEVHCHEEEWESETSNDRLKQFPSKRRTTIQSALTLDRRWLRSQRLHWHTRQVSDDDASPRACAHTYDVADMERNVPVNG